MNLLNIVPGDVSLLHFPTKVCNRVEFGLFYPWFLLRHLAAAGPLHASVEFPYIAKWSGVQPILLHSFTPTPFCSITSMMSVWLFNDAWWSAVEPSPSRVSNGTPASSISTHEAISPRLAARRNDIGSISRVKMKEINHFFSFLQNSFPPFTLFNQSSPKIYFLIFISLVPYFRELPVLDHSLNLLQKQQTLFL